MPINQLVLDIRNKQRQKPKQLDRPTAVWTGRDFNTTTGKGKDDIATLTIIFTTGGCFWGRHGGCTMCGYVYDSADTSPTHEDLLAQFHDALRKLPHEDCMVKIFTSGSFLDVNEIPKETRAAILSELEELPNVKKVITETRPEFVNQRTIPECKAVLVNTDYEIAMGLETSNDEIRDKYINKGFTFKQFTDAATLAKTYGVSTKAYLLLKPPYLSEPEAMADMLTSIDDAAPYAESISMNLCNVQKGTYLEWMWDRGDYRPPWLYTAVEILKKAKVKHPDTILLSDPVGAGSKRGPHNCRTCSKDVASSMERFSRTQDVSMLSVDCDCKKAWDEVMRLDEYGFGAPLTL